MCGIAGIIDSQRPNAATRMVNALAHRGPDDHGVWSDPRVTLVHTRLRIIDLSDGGKQPMIRGSAVLVFNGEIYNFRELRSELEQEGFRFESNSDTEIILAAYSHWGTDCFPRLHGMFAIALYDQTRRELILARDRLGKKPLFYRQAADSFAFASEIKAILGTMNGVPALNEKAVDSYLTYLYIPYPETIFEGIRQLPPASWMRIEIGDDRLKTYQETYWNPLTNSQPLKGSVNALAEETRERVTAAVKDRLIADVPRGVLLSGGIDSSAITAITAQADNEPTRSFSIGFSGNKAYDEIPFAKMVAEQYGCEHQVLEAEPASSRHLARIIWHFDQPFGNPTAILTYILSSLTRKSVTVALAGDGGDEMFGGYPRYIGAYLSSIPRALPQFVRSRLLPWMANSVTDDVTGRHQFRRMREFLEDSGRPAIEMYLRWIGYFSPEDRRDLYQSDFAARIQGHDSGDFLRSLYRESEGLDPINRLAYVDIKSFLCCNVLEYADRMSMAHALELRCPFTDHRLVEFSLRLPFALKFRHAQSKWMLRKAMKPVLPQAVLEKKKLGFNPPVAAWINGELRGLVDSLLSPERLRRRGLFRHSTVESLLEAHRSARRDVSLKLWALIVLEIWFRMYIDGLSVEAVQEEIDRAIGVETAVVV